MPKFLKTKIRYVKFWSGAGWLRKNFTGDGKHHMACCEWYNIVDGKSPIHIDLAKPANPASTQFNYKSVAAHESGHALDTYYMQYSNTDKWKK